MNLGDVIKKYREDHSMSQAAFSRRSGISKGYISMLENNRNPSTGKPLVPTYTIFEAVAKVIGCSTNQLIEMMNEDQMIVFNQTSNAMDCPPDELLKGLEDHSIQFVQTSGIHPVPDDGFVPASSTKEKIIQHLDGMTEDQLEKFLAVIEMIHKPE